MLDAICLLNILSYARFGVSPFYGRQSPACFLENLQSIGPELFSGMTCTGTKETVIFMRMNEPSIKTLIEAVDYAGLRKLLSNNPALANESIPLDDNPALAHPLHRICDGVFNGQYSDEEAVAMAKIFLAHGALINGKEIQEKKDTPLVAAASLHADEVAILYIHHKADIHHAGCNGGTALHWASWCGRDKVVKRLLQENSDVNKKCTEFKGTPLLWAVHGYKFGGGKNRHHQVECVRLLLQAGADKTIPNREGTRAIEFLEEGDLEMMDLLK
jgi:hypothetical protein